MCYCRKNVTVFTVIFLLSAVISTNILIGDSNLQNGSMLFSYLDGKGGNNEEGRNIIIKSSNAENESYMSPISLTKIASADPNFIANMSNNNSEDNELLIIEDENYEEDTKFIPISLVQSNSAIAPASYYDESVADLKYGIVKYIVRSGDTPSSIAMSFGISTYTLLWANNLKVGDYIKPGQELEILPVTGVKHIVKKNDTVESIAKLYKAEAEEIQMFNDLPANGMFADGTEGKTLIVPNGEKEPPLKPKPIIVRDTNQRKVVSSSKYRPANLNPNKGHSFPYGQCTWYVASKVFVPWGGNAKTWLANASAYGYQTGRAPVAGSIVVTTENRWYGHVAYVEAVNGGTITISEMNYVGWGRTSVRVLSLNSPVIRGYIYVK